MDVIPIVTEMDRYGYHSYDIASRLLKDRIIWISDHIDNQSANTVVGQMMILEYQNPNAGITIFLNSTGGSVEDGLAIYDQMRYLRCPVTTVSVGKTFSMAAVLLSSGDKRYAYPNSTIMLHQVSSSIPFSKEPDLEISLEYTKKLNMRLMNILAKNCKKSFEEIMLLSERDNFMTAEEAINFNLIDDIY